MWLPNERCTCRRHLEPTHDFVHYLIQCQLPFPLPFSPSIMYGRNSYSYLQAVICEYQQKCKWARGAERDGVPLWPSQTGEPTGRGGPKLTPCSWVKKGGQKGVDRNRAGQCSRQLPPKHVQRYFCPAPRAVPLPVLTGHLSTLVAPLSFSSSLQVPFPPFLPFLPLF